MSMATQEILESFSHLSEAEKHEVLSEMIRRASMMNFPPLTDDELVVNAEAVFLELDQREVGNG